MNINRDNYESWFLDYLDGTLDAGQKDILLSFLDFNPDLKNELEGMELLSLNAENISYQKKEILKRPEPFPHTELDPGKFETLCISAIENQLSEDEKDELNDLLSNDPEKEKIYGLYESTLLKADLSITYPEKSELRKRFIDLPGLRIAVSIAAASAVIILAVSGLFRNPEGQELLSDNSDIGAAGKTEQEEKISKLAITEETVQDEKNYHTETTAEKAPASIAEKTSATQVKKTEIEQEPSNLLTPDVRPDMSGDLHMPLIALKPREAEFISHGEIEEQGIIAYHFRDNSPFLTDYSAPNERERRKINFWKLADHGLQKINEMSEEDYSLVREVDEQGQTRRLTFETPIFGISAPLGNSSPAR